MNKRIGIVGEFNPNSETHCATNNAISHSAQQAHLDVSYRWIGADEISPTTIGDLSGVWFCTGAYNNTEKVLGLIRQARESHVPTLGTCGGFQHLILELGRNVLGLKDAAHEELSPSSATLVVTKLTCSLAGRAMKVKIRPGSKVFTLYGTSSVLEHYYCNYGVNPEYVEELERSGIQIVGSDDEGIVRVIELTDHPYFVGTLFVPQAGSTQGNPHPIVTGFLQASIHFGCHQSL